MDSGDKTPVGSSIGSGKCSLRTSWDRLIDGEFNSEKPAILVNFGFIFVARIRTRQLVDLGEDSFFIPRLIQLEERWFVIYTCHFRLCRTLCPGLFVLLFLLPSEVELFKQCVTARGETIASVIVKQVKRV